jgi:hypothetical protein
MVKPIIHCALGIAIVFIGLRVGGQFLTTLQKPKPAAPAAA